MGTAESRFRDAMKNGNQQQAYELYYSKKISRDSIDPEEPCNDNSGDCLIHYAALHAMEDLYREFIVIKKASPLQCNLSSQNSLHVICSRGDNSVIRARMLLLSLNTPLVKTNISIALQAQDEDGNTALHMAAHSGLMACVEHLLEVGGDVLITNKEGHTPGDRATAARHSNIAKKLETRVVFLPSLDPAVVRAVNEEEDLLDEESIHQQLAMADHELQTMKDTLLIETSQLLGVSLFLAEALLRNHDWSKEQLLDAWMLDPAATCDKAGVSMPNVLSEDNFDDILSSGVSMVTEEEEECGICCLPITQSVSIPCDHSFCTDCWQQYLHGKISEGDVHNIVCPDYGCYHLVPVHVMERLVSREMAQRYLRFDIKAFVDSNPTIRWCPRAGCGQAVSRPHTDESPSPIDIIVHCGNDHYFCWECGDIPHAPCDCTEWAQWLQKIKQMEPEIGNLSPSEQRDAASSQWIASYSKPCPRCKCPIEKTSGCNHMQCYKCHHDFCWMCLLPWKEHSSSTGGYFMCNRYKEREKADQLLDHRQAETSKMHFLHYYKRYQNHCHSLKLEESFLLTAQDKMAELARAAEEERAHIGSLQFVDGAVRELVLARCVLIASYARGFSILVVRIRDEFEALQGDLEEHVESLAEVVARPHLRKPRSEIIRITRLMRDKRTSFVQDVNEGIRVDSPHIPHMNEALQRINQLQRDRRAEHTRVAMEEKQRREDSKRLNDAIVRSRQEYEEDSKLKQDTELAIALSMQLDKNGSPVDDSAHQLTPPSLPHQSLSQNNTSDTTWGAIPVLAMPHPLTMSRPPTMPRPSTLLPTQTLPSSAKHTTNEDQLLTWRRALIEGWDERPSSSSSSEEDLARAAASYGPVYGEEDLARAAAASYGPVYGEEEDLARAIQLSLAESSLSAAPKVQWNNLDID